MKRITCLLTIAIILLATAGPASVFAADASASIGGSKTVRQGETAVITVTFKGSSIGFVDSQLTYDSEKMQYLSGGSSEGDAGLVQLKSWSSDAGGQIIFKLKFKGVQTGEVTLNLSTLETTNINGDQDMGTPKASKTIQVVEASKETTASESSQETSTDPFSTEIDMGQDSEDETQTSPKGGVLIGILVGVILIGAICLILWRLKKK